MIVIPFIILLLLIFVISTIILMVFPLKKKLRLVQDVKQLSYVRKTYIVKTFIQVVGWPMMNHICSEDLQIAYRVPENKVGEVKDIQYKKAYPIYIELKSLLDCH